MIAAGSRGAAPIETIVADDQPTTCGYCGNRTQLVRSFVANNPKASREVCNHCQQKYIVEQEDDEAVDGANQISPATGQLDPNHPLPEASQTDLNHLLGVKPIKHPDFGSF